EEKWSPDVVVGYAKRLGKFEYVPSTKTLYNWIDEGKLSVINMDLAMKLRRSTKKAKSRKHKKVLGTSIEERPESIETREEFGHWEIDTVLGHKSNDDALLTLVERRTRHKIIRRIPSKTAPAVTDALQDIFSEYPDAQNVFKSITADNGSEFSELSDQGKKLGIDVYFSRPYASWERGKNERHNGLIRRFIKKGQPIDSYSDERIDDVENWMNTLPRKILDYQTPGEAFAKFRPHNQQITGKPYTAVSQRVLHLILQLRILFIIPSTFFLITWFKYVTSCSFPFIINLYVVKSPCRCINRTCIFRSYITFFSCRISFLALMIMPSISST